MDKIEFDVNDYLHYIYAAKFNDDTVVKKIKQIQNQKAIEVLENVKKYFVEEEIDEDGAPTGDWVILRDSSDVAEYIDSKIQELRSNNNEDNK